MQSRSRLAAMMGGLVGLLALTDPALHAAMGQTPDEPLHPRPAPLEHKATSLLGIRFDSRRRKPDGPCTILPAGRLISVNVGPNRAARRVRNRSRCKRGVRQD